MRPTAAEYQVLYLPYTGRELHPRRGYGWGRADDRFSTETEARAHFRKLRQERRAEDIQIFAIHAGERGGWYKRLIVEWRDY